MERTGTRALVLTSEGAGHWYRRTLKPELLRSTAMEPPPAPALSREDGVLFVTSFAAFFVIISAFIA